jgi:protein-S-isoprenylcysteine O-methyltransferase Ste14
MINNFKPHPLERCGRILFKFRAWIAVPFFLLLVLLSRPAMYTGIACVFLITGLAIRVWAAGYIGTSARNTSFETPYRITDGPYKILYHPLYIGNFLLVIGVTILYNPPLVYAVIIGVLFIMMYGLIIASEHMYVKRLPQRTTGFSVRNCAGEISTIVILTVIFMIHIFIPKNLY